MVVKKRVKYFLIGILLLSGINLVQAYYWGGLGNFRLGTINPQDLYLAIAFIVSFFIFNIAFSKFFSEFENSEAKKSAWIPALFLAIGTTYGLWRTGFDFGILFSRINLSYEIWAIIVGILVFIFIVFLMKEAKKKFNVKFKTNVFFVILGIIFLLLGMQNIVYSAGSAILIGIILIVVGIFPAINKMLKSLKVSGKKKYKIIKEIKE